MLYCVVCAALLQLLCTSIFVSVLFDNFQLIIGRLSSTGFKFCSLADIALRVPPGDRSVTHLIKDILT